jgi:DNA-binding transcriptional ArsR family regulator
MVDDVIILEPGDERAQKIAKAISSQTASDILNHIQEEPSTASEISGRLQLPLTTVQYHLENLVAADMLDVVEKRWSKKGREIKVYGLRNQVVIVAPRGEDLRSLLLRYASLFGIVLFAGLVMAVILSMLGGMTPPSPALEKGGNGVEDMRVTYLGDGGEGEGLLTPVLFFVCGGAVALLALTIRELWRSRSLFLFRG